MNTVDIDNCMDCPRHSVQRDPDPNDWFCDDDEKVVCMRTQDSLGICKSITEACRPYNKRKECAIPDWCPRLTPKPKPTKCNHSWVREAQDIIRCTRCGIWRDE